MYTQQIECPVCGRAVTAYRPETQPPNGREKVEQAHVRGENVGYLTPYRHKRGSKSGTGWCFGHLNRFLLPYKPITQESKRGLYMLGHSGRSICESPAIWAGFQVRNRYVVNGYRED